jgi:hypothetical protein
VNQKFWNKRTPLVSIGLVQIQSSVPMPVLVREMQPEEARRFLEIHHAAVRGTWPLVLPDVGWGPLSWRTSNELPVNIASTTYTWNLPLQQNPSIRRGVTESKAGVNGFFRQMCRWPPSRCGSDSNDQKLLSTNFQLTTLGIGPLGSC